MFPQSLCAWKGGKHVSGTLGLPLTLPSFPWAQRTGLGRAGPVRQLCPACVLDCSRPFHFEVHLSAKCLLRVFSESPQLARDCRRWQKYSHKSGACPLFSQGQEMGMKHCVRKNKQAPRCPGWSMTGRVLYAQQVLRNPPSLKDHLPLPVILMPLPRA